MSFDSPRASLSVQMPYVRAQANDQVIVHQIAQWWAPVRRGRQMLKPPDDRAINTPSEVVYVVSAQHLPGELGDGKAFFVGEMARRQYAEPRGVASQRLQDVGSMCQRIIPGRRLAMDERSGQT